MNRPWIRFAVVFLAGIVAGAALYRTIGRDDGRGYSHKSPEKRTEHLVMKLTRKLDLAPDQQEKVRTVLETRDREMERLREEWRPRMEASWAGARTELRTVLNDEQWIKFEELERKFKEKRMRRKRQGSSSRSR